MMDAPLLALTRRAPGPPPGYSPRAAATENMRQLIQLRWLAVGGQLVAILVSHFGLGVLLPLAPMLGVIALLAAANLFFTLTLRRALIVRGELLLALLFDMAALTAQLYLSGGATNPFVSLYLIQVVLGAILLPLPALWPLVATAALCFAFLTQNHAPLNLPERLWDRKADLMMIGEWINFALVATLLALFITRISRNLRARDVYVTDLGQRAIEEDHIVRMALFASGAAHELGTPLSTLSVLIADWRRDPLLAAHPQLAEELEEAEREVERCREIVSDILDSAGLARGEAMGSERIADLVGDIVEAWTALHPETPLQANLGNSEEARVAAEPALRQAIWSLLENAAEASPGGISLSCETSHERLSVAVADRGPGFSANQLERVGQLHQSTKGAGHGVGLFLASNVARRLGGSLEAANREDGGAIVTVSLPLASAIVPGP